MTYADVQNFIQNPSVYTSPPRKKDFFLPVYEMLADARARTVLDVGCASGDFLHFLPPRITGTGIDKSAELIRIARERMGESRHTFLEREILAGTGIRDLGAFDAVTLLGVLSTFLDFRAPLDRVLELGADLIVINGPFNDSPIDALHYHRDLAAGETEYSCCYAIPSMKSIGEYLHSKGSHDFTFSPFRMTSELARDPEHPLRNYHVTLDNGQRYLTNGAGILFREYFLVIRRP